MRYKIVSSNPVEKGSPNDEHLRDEIREIVKGQMELFHHDPIADVN